ncbi:LysR family transcriptional regulator [Massilia cavernae]|uniref:LysR family transcriptional regulator n=1 Tax=Massilia cavernae TaxID=2320864 RepID=A0A418Y6D2_9BURK|nr:LysR family transcriptional regulator [Massilia cavernae]RJG23439.1 LysR family transcriptional regulator [Massilia cavernae]
MSINELRSISTFIAAAELGSLRKAAAAQGLSPQAASQALAQLERHLDVRLFHRTTRVMSLTDEGRSFLEEAQPALLSLQRALQNVKHTRDEIAGPLRIIGPRTTFRPIIWPLIEEFCDQYPGIQPDVQLEDRVGNWVEDRVDVGFRIGVAPHEGVIARRLFPLQLVACATPGYIERFGAPASAGTLVSHQCSVYRSPGTGKIVPWRLKVNEQVLELALAPYICTNDEGLELQAVLAGRCIGQLAGVTAAPYLRSGELLPLLVEQMPDISSYFIYFGSRASQPARARAFIDLALRRLVDNTEYVLSTEELAAGEQQALDIARRTQRGRAS